MKRHNSSAPSNARTIANACNSVATGNTYEKELRMPMKYARALVIATGRWPTGNNPSKEAIKTLKMVKRNVKIIFQLCAALSYGKS